MRNYKPKGVHTSPEKAGSQNIENCKKDYEQDDLMKNLIEMMENGKKSGQVYSGQWTDEQFAEEVHKYFQYCSEHSVKTSKASLRLWLGCSRAQYYDWETKKEKYGAKSDILIMANDIMEAHMINRAEKYPTANIFLLKTSHGHVEANKLDITTNGNDINSADEVRDLVSKLGLEKK